MQGPVHGGAGEHHSAGGGADLRDHETGECPVGTAGQVAQDTAYTSGAHRISLSVATSGFGCEEEVKPAPPHSSWSTQCSDRGVGERGEPVGER